MVNILDGVAREGVIQAEFISMAHIQVLGRHIFTYSSAPGKKNPAIVVNGEFLNTGSGSSRQ